MPSGFTIVGIGEALFDLFPGEARLGGAPLNVAVHAHRLAGDAGRGVVVTRVGQDELGDQVVQELVSRGMSTQYIQRDPDRATGRVVVDIDFEGTPSYDIATASAYDNLQFDPDLEHLAATCAAVCYGTLAQRDGQTRNTIYRFLDAAKRAFRLFDVNLRSSGGRDLYDTRILRRSCERATAIKLNVEELPIVLDGLGLVPPAHEDDAARTLLTAFPIEMVVLTRGAGGTVLFGRAGGRYEGAQAQYSPARDADSVGAGDACSAAVLIGRVRRLPPQRLVDLANHAGAFVASQQGGTAELPDEIAALART